MLLASPISNGIIGDVKADASITLDLTVDLLEITPGRVANTTLEVTNNATSIHDFNISIDDTGLCDCWNITITQTSLTQVFPYASDSVEIIVALEEPATMNDSAEAVVNVSRSDGTYSVIRMHLAVGAVHMPEIDAEGLGDSRVVTMGPGTSAEYQVTISNLGTANDTILLSVEEQPDLAGFWSVDNGSNGNGTGGNGTGNGTGGNGSLSGPDDDSGRSVPRDNGSSVGYGNATSTAVSARWLDDVLADMEAGTNVTARLNVTVPNGTEPGSYGLRLHASSTRGNITASTTIVVNVSGVRAVAFEFGGTPLLIPSESTNATIVVTNAGTLPIENTYVAAATSGPCTVTANNPVGERLSGGGHENTSITIATNPSAHHGDVCSIRLSANDSVNDVIDTWEADLIVGYRNAVRMVGPASATVLTPGSLETVDIAIHNDGTEAISVRINEQNGSADIQVGAPSLWTTVNSGSFEYLQVSLLAVEDTQLVGMKLITLALDVRSERNGTPFNETTPIETIDLEIEPWIGLRFMLPQSTSWPIEPGATTAMPLYVVNDGTGGVNAALTWTDLPVGFSLQTENGTLSLTPGGNGSTTANPGLSGTASASLVSGTHSITLSLLDPASAVTLATASATIEVAPRAIASLHSAATVVQVGHTGSTTTTISLTNIGNAEDQFSLSTDAIPSGLRTTLSPDSVRLAAGASETVTLTTQEDSSSFSGGALTITATPAVNAAGTSYVSFTTVISESRAEVTLSPSAPNVPGGGNATLNAFLVNRGVADETYLLEVSSALDCVLANDRVAVSAQAAAIEIEFTCSAPASIPAGTHDIMLIARPLSSPSLSSSANVTATVTPIVGEAGSLPLSITIHGSDLKLTSGGTLTIDVIIKNMGNRNASGVVFLGGEDATGLAREWSKPITGTSLPSYHLGPSERVTLQLELTSPEDEGGARILWVEVSENGGGSARSEPFTIAVEPKHEAPDGLAFPLGLEADNQTSMALLSSGWILALLSLLVLNMVLKGRQRAAAEAAAATVEAAQAVVAEAATPEPAEEAPTLAPGEARSEDGITSCPHCRTRSRLPTDKEPPFRFRCPTCEEMVRVIE